MKQLSILVADDEPGILSLMKDAISRRGHKVTCVENGVEAVDSLMSGKHDMIFLDIRMPKGDGLTALKQIQSRWPDMPVIVITGCGQSDLVNEVVNLGAFACLVKPFSIKDAMGMMQCIYPGA
ncbi:MAG: response regulator [Armatimonadota bacterium]